MKCVHEVYSSAELVGFIVWMLCVCVCERDVCNSCAVKQIPTTTQVRVPRTGSGRIMENNTHAIEWSLRGPWGWWRPPQDRSMCSGPALRPSHGE